MRWAFLGAWFMAAAMSVFARGSSMEPAIALGVATIVLGQIHHEEESRGA
jgi:hypothetical protein